MTRGCTGDVHGEPVLRARSGWDGFETACESRCKERETFSPKTDEHLNFSKGAVPELPIQLLHCPVTTFLQLSIPANASSES